jgi:hypothetical protein
MATVLIPIPATDFHPTETGVPWQTIAAICRSVPPAARWPGDAQRFASGFAKLLASSAPSP